MAQTIDARVKQKTGTAADFAGYTLLEGEIALVRTSANGPVWNFKVGPGNFDSLDWSLQNPGAAQKADTSTVFPAGVPGLYIPTEDGTYEGETVDLSVGYVQLIWDGATLVKAEFPIDVEGAIESELNQAPVDYNETFGKTASGNSTDNVLTWHRWTYPDAIVDKDGAVTEISFYLGAGGDITFVVADIMPNKAAVRLYDEVSFTGAAGLNTFPCFLEIKKGQALIMKGATSAVPTTVRFGNASDPNTGASQYVQVRTNGTVAGNASGYYSYSFEVRGVDKGPLKNDLVEKGHIRTSIEKYAETVPTSDVKQELGDAYTGSGTITGLTGNEYLTIDQPAPFDCIVKQIRVKTGAAGGVVFAAGLIEQSGIFIEEYTFLMNAVTGDNTFYVERELKQGQQLAIKTPGSATNTIGLSTGSGAYWRSESPGYGEPLERITGNSLAFQYDAYKKYDHVFASSQSVADIGQRVTDLENKPVIVLSQPGGYKFRLVCDDDGSNLRTQALYPLSVVVLGNSITYHALASYWPATRGMAASEDGKDFVGVLETMLKAFNPSATVTPQNIYTWETTHGSYDLNTLNPMLAGKDCVIIRLGENVPNNTVSTLQVDTEALIDHIRGQLPDAIIAITGNFWAHAGKDAAFQAAASSRNIPYIPLVQLETPENKSYIGAQIMGDDEEWHTVSNSGVAAHPGDLGMQRIAETIFNSLF